MDELKPCPFFGGTKPVDGWHIVHALRAEVARLTAERDALLDANRWIPISVIPPDDPFYPFFSIEVQLLLPNPNYTNMFTLAGYYEKTNCRWWCFWDRGNQKPCNPTHWRPLPPPPESEGE